MSNFLPIEKQAHIMSLLCEGVSVRSAERLTGIDKKTILRVMIRVADRALQIANPLLMNLECRHIQVDEVWTFVAKKQAQVRREELYYQEKGSQFLFVAMDTDTKLVPCFTLGKRDTHNAKALMRELKKRVKGQFQLTTDGFNGYDIAAHAHLKRRGVHYSQTIKHYRENTDQQRRYSPPRLEQTTKRTVFGLPDLKIAGTSHIERQNLTVRMSIRRFARLSNAFSKKFDNLLAACVVHFFHYNFLRKHGTIGTTPAVRAGITDRVWDWNDLLVLPSQQKAA